MSGNTSEVNIERFIEELDRLLSMDESEKAEKLLEDTLRETKEAGDMSAGLTVLNEMSGFFRIKGDKEKSLYAAEEALKLVGELRISESISGATTFLNSATSFKAFGRVRESLDYYREAKRIYDRLLPRGDYRFAGLYNNFALALTEVGSFEEAEKYFTEAAEILRHLPNGYAETAMTFVNMALLYEKAGKSEKEISALILRALDCFDDERAKRDSYYAFCCKKSAPTIGYFGFFEAKEELLERADAIYEKMREELL